MGRKENAGAGVTLIELVVALTLGAIIMMAIGAMYSSSTKMLFGSVKGYQNQVEASLAVENMARGMENSVWVNVIDADNDYSNGLREGATVCVATDYNGDGDGDTFIESIDGLKDDDDNYNLYFYDYDVLRSSSCTKNCATCASGEILAGGISYLKFIQQGLDDNALAVADKVYDANEKNVIKVEFQGGADSDNRKSVQVTKINLRGRGSYGYYD